MPTEQMSYLSLTIRTIVVHTVTYFIAGLAASVLLGYANLFALPELSCYMRPVSDRWVMAGPLLQPIRGAIFGSVFYMLRERLFVPSRGWIALSTRACRGGRSSPACPRPLFNPSCSPACSFSGCATRIDGG
jgi:hypothetical protein